MNTDLLVLLLVILAWIIFIVCMIVIKVYRTITRSIAIHAAAKFYQAEGTNGNVLLLAANMDEFIRMGLRRGQK